MASIPKLLFAATVGIFIAQFSNLSNAEISSLSLGTSGNISAAFPCAAHKRQASGPTGIVNALECNVTDGQNFCNFILSVQDNDQNQYNKHGMKWIEAVYSAYADQLGGYERSSPTLSTYPNIGKSLSYAFVRDQSGVAIQVKAVWIVIGTKVVRATTSCGKNNPNYIKAKRELFLNGLTLIK